tara:strand:- start:2116 stop:2463 length:348 start_codon:yes stop_codon:yes gene_type:complete
VTDNEWAHPLIVRAIGSAIGVIASMIVVAPAGTRNALYRGLVGAVMGFVFAPVAPHLWGLDFLAGENLDVVLARGAAMGFVIWWILELIARLLSSSEWVDRLVKELARKRAGGGE